MKTKRLFTLMVLLCAVFHLRAQTSPGDDRGAVAAIKTNLPYWGVGGTFNLGAEFRLARHWTLDLEAGLNPFDGKNDDGSYDRTMKHFRAHPELRYWFCESFQGHFLGLHVPFIAYNLADLKVLDLENRASPRLGNRRRRQLRIPMAPLRALEPGGHARRRIPLPRLRQVPL